MRRLIGTATVLLVSGGMGGGCLVDQASESDLVEERQEAILNGGNVLVDTWGTPNWGCSSALMRGRWIITAKHCGLSAGATAQIKNGGTAQVTNPVFNHPSLDVTVGRLASTLLPLGDPALSGPFPLYKGSVANLLNKTLYCQGWGINAPDGSGGGVLRQANLLVDQVNTATPTYCNGADNTDCYRLTKNAQGQLLAPGDSGGPCWLPGSTQQQYRRTGVQSTWNGVDKDWQPAAPHFRDWANGITGTAPTLGTLMGFEGPNLTSWVVYTNGSNHLIGLGYRDLIQGKSWFRSDLTTVTGAPNVVNGSSTGFNRSDGSASIAYRGADDHIWELSYDTLAPTVPGWTTTNVTLSSGGPLALGPPASYGRSDQYATIVYRGSDNHVWELSHWLTGGWGSAGLSWLAGSPTAAGDPVGYVRSDTVNAVVYRTSNNHIWELSLPMGGTSWTGSDLTAAAGAPNAVGRPRPYTRSDGVSAVVFRSSDNRVRELSMNSSGGWTALDLTQASGAAVAASDPFAYVRSDDVSCVIFKTSDNHIHELSLSGTTWTNTDLTTSAGAPAATASAGINAYVRIDQVNTVIYKTSDNHIRELRRAKGAANWTHTDLTNAVGGVI
jgi:hypothetical protein